MYQIWSILIAKMQSTMIRVTTLFTAVLLLLATAAVAQEAPKSAIKGVVLDKQSQYELIGVNVIIPGSDPLIGAASELDGSFRLENVPVGRHVVQVSFLGYETVTLSNLMVLSGKELDLRIELEESVNEMQEVVITANDDKRESINKMATVSARTFSVEEAARYSGALQDPARMAANFAGVSGASDDRNDIIIRGNSPTGVLWRLEGIDIPSPNHFSTIGTTGGPVGMLNLNNLANSDFMTGAWSSEYGNALSGVFDLRLRNGNSDKREYLGQLGFNGFELGAEGPFKKGGRASYMANFRYSTLEVFQAMGFDLGTGAAIPQYKDGTFKINVPTKNAGRFTLFGIGGNSFIEFKAEDSNDRDLFSSDRENTRFNSETGVIGASHTYFFNKNTFSKLVVAASTTTTSGTIDTLDLNTNLFGHQTGFDRAQNKYSLNWRLNRKINARHTVTGGVLVDYYDLDMVDSTAVSPGAGYLSIANFKGSAPLGQVYAQWQYRMNDSWTLNSGLHAQYLQLNGSTALEPRLGLKYKASERHTLSFGTGMHSQLQPIVVYFINEHDENGTSYNPNESLDFTRSIHTIAGHDWLIGTDLRLKSEIYYQYIYGAPVDTASSSFSMLNEGADFELPSRTGLSNDGTGYNYGLELTLEKFFTNGYYFLVTTSLFDSRYEGSDGVTRSTAFNGNWVGNALGGYEFKLGKASTLSFDTKVTMSGGRRFTPINLELSQQFNSEILVQDEAFSDRYDDYFRFDFKITFRHNGNKIAQQFSVDLQNATNNQNIFVQGYNARTGNIGTTYQRGFFPDVQYKIFF